MYRERALAKRHHIIVEKLNEHVKGLELIDVGQSVLVQNQHGSTLSEWGNSATDRKGIGLRFYLGPPRKLER